MLTVLIKQNKTKIYQSPPPPHIYLSIYLRNPHPVSPLKTTLNHTAITEGLIRKADPLANDHDHDQVGNKINKLSQSSCFASMMTQTSGSLEQAGCWLRERENGIGVGFKVLGGPNAGTSIFPATRPDTYQREELPQLFRGAARPGPAQRSPPAGVVT